MAGTIDIFRPDQTKLATVTFDTSSRMLNSVMGENLVELDFRLPQVDNDIHVGFLEIPVGSYINYKDNRYTLFNPSDFTKNGNRKYSYKLRMHAYQEMMHDRVLINEAENQPYKNSLQARPEEFLRIIVRNMNYFDTGNWDGIEWSVGECITTDVLQLIQLNGVSCMDALNSVAQAYKTEWEVAAKTIHLKKVEYNRNVPLKLMYGGGSSRDLENGGFKAGLGRGNFDDNRPVHKMYVQGGERNIEPSEYGTPTNPQRTLKLPKNATLQFDGTHFYGEQGYDSSIARTYVTDATGSYIIRNDVEPYSKREFFQIIDQAYPSRVGTITRIVYIYNNVEYTTYQAALTAATNDGADGGSVFVDVFDNTIPDELNYANMRIGGEQIMFVPQTGRLSGTEISVLQGEADASDGYIHSERRFKLITESNLGGWMPDGRLAVGDTYAIFGIKLPQTYIDAAEHELLKEAIRVKFENEEQRFTFRGELDGIWAQRHWDNVNDKLRIGGYVNFTDNHFQPNGTIIRISAITEYLHKPMQPEIELTNVVMGRGLLGELAKIPDQELVIEENEAEVRRLEMRRWRDVTELRSQIGNVFTEFSESINPATVSSMQIVAGSERGQFIFSKSSVTNIQSNAPIIEFNSTANTLSIKGDGIFDNGYAYMKHLTLGIDALDGKTFSGSHNTQVRPFTEYRTFEVRPRNFAGMLRDKLYWLYIKAPVSTGERPIWELTTDIHSNLIEDGFYWFVVGALNSEYEGTRSFSRLFGYTEILPGQITTSMIRSTDGVTYFDLEAGEIAGKIKFLDGLISGHIGITNNAGEITAFLDGNNNPTSNIAFGAGGDGDNAKLKVLHDGNMSTTATINALGSIISGLMTGKRVAINGSSGNIELYDAKNDLQITLDVGGNQSESWGNVLSGFLSLYGITTGGSWTHQSKFFGGELDFITTDGVTTYECVVMANLLKMLNARQNTSFSIDTSQGILTITMDSAKNVSNAPFIKLQTSSSGTDITFLGLPVANNGAPPSGLNSGDLYISTNALGSGRHVLGIIG